MDLKQGDAATTTPLINSLFAEMMRDQRGPDYVVQTKIIPDVPGNRLIVTGPKEEMRVLAGVVEQLDQAPEAAGGARVFKLNNADAVKVVGVVSNAMLKFDARNNPLRRISVSADRESNSVVVSGPRQDLQDAASIIERLDNEGLDGLPITPGSTNAKPRPRAAAHGGQVRGPGRAGGAGDQSVHGAVCRPGGHQPGEHHARALRQAAHHSGPRRASWLRSRRW